ncbi:MAG: DUF1579 domain-containing protein [Pirellulaceae bacterium]
MNKRQTFPYLAILLWLSVGAVAAAQPAASSATTGAKWLEKFVGSWETSSTAAAEAGGGDAPMEGTIESKMVGKFWLVTSMTAELGAFKMKGLQTIGYDSKKKAYVGTWIDNSSEFMWHYKGSVDESGQVLSLEAMGPDMTDASKQVLYRDMYEFVSKDKIQLTSSVKGPDGKWIDFMTGIAKRTP